MAEVSRIDRWAGKAFLAAAATVLLTALQSPVMAQAFECERTPITQNSIAELIAADLSKFPDEQAKDTRYITLTNLLNACATDDQMKLYRHAVVKLLNSLSWAPQPVRGATIDPDRTIIRMSLSGLGWTIVEWERLLHLYPYALKPDTEAFGTLTKRSGSPLPYLRGDWFTYLAARPPHYYNLLKLPRSIKQLELKLGPEAAGQIRYHWGNRTGYTEIEVDGVKRKVPKIIYTDKLPEKPAAKGEKTGYVDASGFPTGNNVRRVPRFMASTSHFKLPNGFRGYYLHHAIGPRLDKNPMHPCLTCNFAGLTADLNLSGEGDEDSPKLKSSGLYPVSSQMLDTIRRDEDERNAAMRAAGLEPSLTSDTGVEPIRALGEKFANEPLTLTIAAAELGIARDVLEDQMLKGDKKSLHMARVLSQQSMQRGLFQGRFKTIAEAATGLTVLRNKHIGGFLGFGSTIPQSNWGRRQIGGRFSLTLVSDKSAYQRGELLQLSIQPQVSCNLLLVAVSADGSGLVLFPNRFSQETYMPGGKIIVIPGKSGPFKLRLGDKGTEKIYSFCNADNRWSGIKHEFGKTPFTKIADFEKYLKSRKTYRSDRQKSSNFGVPPLMANSSITFTVD